MSSLISNIGHAQVNPADRDSAAGTINGAATINNKGNLWYLFY